MAFPYKHDNCRRVSIRFGIAQNQLRLQRQEATFRLRELCGAICTGQTGNAPPFVSNLCRRRAELMGWVGLVSWASFAERGQTCGLHEEQYMQGCWETDWVFIRAALLLRTRAAKCSTGNYQLVQEKMGNALLCELPIVPTKTKPLHGLGCNTYILSAVHTCTRRYQRQWNGAMHFKSIELKAIPVHTHSPQI